MLKFLLEESSIHNSINYIHIVSLCGMVFYAQRVFGGYKG